MACILKDKNGNVTSVTADNGKPSQLFDAINKIPVFENRNKAAEFYAYIVSEKYNQQKDLLLDNNGEPVLFFKDLTTTTDPASGQFKYETDFLISFNKDKDSKGIQIGFLKGTETQTDSAKNFVQIEKFERNLNPRTYSGFIENMLSRGVQLTTKTKSELSQAGSVGELNVVDKTKDILDEVTDEKIGEKKYQDFSIDFEDGARAFGTIENGVANISGINAPKKEDSVIEPKRGTKTYERVIEKLKENGIKTIKVSLQSQDSQTALSKLVEKGILSNPRDMQGVSDSQFATTFDIQPLKQTPPALRDVESTAKALEYVAKSGAEIRIPYKGKFADGKEFTVDLIKTQKYTDFSGTKRSGFKGLANSTIPYESVSEAYHKAKADGSNPELVKAVESLLSKEQTPKAGSVGVGGDVKQQELDAQRVNKEAGVDIYVARQVVDANSTKYTLSQINENGNTNTFIIEDANGNEVGKAQLSVDGNYLENIRIDENHRRKGLASKVYDFIELRKGIELKPSPNKQSKEAKALWDNRNLKKSEQSLKEQQTQTTPEKTLFDRAVDSLKSFVAFKDTNVTTDDTNLKKALNAVDLKTPNGIIYGASYVNADGQQEIYINPEKLSIESLIHENFHPFQVAIREAAKSGDPQAKAFIDRMLELAKQEVKDNFAPAEAEQILAQFENRLTKTSTPETTPVNFFAIGQKGAMALDRLEGGFNRLKRLKEARQLEAQGKEPLYIKYLTGWERQDGKWKMEIDDYTDIKTTPEQLLGLKENIGAVTTVKEFMNNANAEILKAFPSIGDIYVRYDENATEAFAHYDPQNNEIVFYKDSLDRPLEVIKSSLLHELQHSIQIKEGFEFGADLETAKQLAELKNISDYEAYKRSIGETEARNTQRRMIMSVKDRLLTLLDDTADVLPEDRISLQEVANLTERTARELDGAKFVGNKEVKPIANELEVVNGFYSPIEKILTETKIEKQSGAKWLSVVGKGDEATWTGVKDWLEENSQKQISKSEIQQWMKDNRIEIVEVVKGGIVTREDAEKQGFKIEQVGDKWVATAPNDNYDFVKMENSTLDALLISLTPDLNKEDATKFSQYQLAGDKENYKELLVTMPSKSKTLDDISVDLYGVSYSQLVAEYPNSFQSRQNRVNEVYKNTIESGQGGKQFKSTHFEEPNILVHLRMNTRTDANGNKVLFLEEIQSDWGQQGKKEGFESPERKATDKKIAELWDKQKEAEINVTKLMRKAREEKPMTSIAEQISLGNKDVEQAHNAVNEIQKQRMALVNSIRSMNGGVINPIPSAPFVTDTNAWTKLGLKVALKEAVKQGADKIAWSTGEQQNERYDLSKQVDEITYNKLDNGDYRVVVYKDGDALQRQDLKENELESNFGKDVAERIVNDKGDIDKNSGVKSLSGVNLSVGGKGMIGFYGSPTENKLGIVGNVAKSLFKQEPKTVEIETGVDTNEKEIIWEDLGDGEQRVSIGGEDKYFSTEEAAKKYVAKLKSNKVTQHSIDITPELKQQVQAGLPMFKAGEDLGKTFLSNLMSNPAYENYTGDQLLDELITTMVGKTGEQLLGEPTAQNKTFFDAVKEAVVDAIKWLAEKFGVSLKDKTADQILNMKLGELVSAGLASARKGEFLQNKIEKLKAILNEENILSPQLVESNLFLETNQELLEIADKYKNSKGLSLQTPELVLNVSQEDAKRVADAYESAVHNPDDPTVKKAFNQLLKEIKEQADILLRSGYVFQIAKEGEGYNSNSKEMVKDVKQNKRIFVDSSSESFGTTRTFDENNIGLQDSGYKDVNGIPMTNVEVIRGVHDLFGHAKYGNGFGAVGEENAWRIHMAMFSPLAQKALTITTRGQNSWVNFGNHMRNADGSIKKITDPGYLSPKNRPFAEQKITLLPDWALTKAYGDVVTVGNKKITPANKHVISGTNVYEITDAKAFYSAITAAKKSRGLDGIQVDNKSVAEFEQVVKEGGRLFITQDGLAGVVLKGDGYVGMGFAHNNLPKGSNILKPLLQLTIKLGATYADAYDTFLPRYYAKFGFKPFNRLKFNPEFAEKGWEKTILNTQPDVVTMYWDGGDRTKVEQNYDIFEPYDKTQGTYTEDYDAALAATKEKSFEKTNQVSITPPKIPNKQIVSLQFKPAVQVTEFDPTTNSIAAFRGDNYVGRINTQKVGDDYIITHSSVVQKEQGKQIGTTMYLGVIEFANNQSRIVYSDQNPQPQAKAIWEKLVDANVAEINGNRYMVLPDTLATNRDEPLDIDALVEKMIQNNDIMRNCKL